MNDELIDAVNHRADGKPFPINFPEGWVPMTIAVDAVGSALLADGFNFMHFRWAEFDAVEPQNPSLDAHNAARIAYAKRHQRRVADAFSKALLNGQMRSGYATLGGGAVTPIAPDLWRTDDPLLRFRTYSIDPADPFSERVDLPCWIWIELEGLRYVCDLLKRERNGWGPPPPKLTPRTETYISLEGQHQLWRTDEYGNTTVQIVEPPKARGPGRPGVTDKVIAIFADHVRSQAVATRCSWEGEAIAKEWRDGLIDVPAYIRPPKATTCADRIRDYYNVIDFGSDGRSILNVAEVLEAMKFPINPDKSPAIG